MTAREIVFSIIIVNYNSGDLLEKCLSSIFNYIESGLEIIIYDNASTDDSLSGVELLMSAHPEINIIYGKENLGFAKANNLAAYVAKGTYFHFLNPDILVNEQLQKDYLSISREAENPVYVTSLTDEQGRLLKNRHIVPTLGNYYNRLFHREKVAYWNIGASVILHREAFSKTGGWAEDYFMYAEDLDLFYSLYKNKIPVNYLDTRLIHIGKGSTRKVWSEYERSLIVERSFKRFYKKQGFLWEYYIIRPILLTFVLLNEPASFLLLLRSFLRTVFIRIR
jgi:GT2 family glycosyltransferase